MDRTILIVEDDAMPRDLLAANFDAIGYRVSCAGNIAEARALTSDIAPDVVLLGRIVKGKSALVYVRQLRREQCTAEAAIIVIGWRVPKDPDPVVVLDSGADDYLIMPFSMKMLLVRVEAVKRRLPSHSKATPWS
jgi:DNA-binding response OmpR family regulator